ncbi:hypothetical protein H7I77_26835 [Mycolicibacterium novocastrense]|uniref:Uncharacterized protein n=1 Tax=Mycolicibacterium novocastrense TaxID=59813 RepID=A0AAW5SRV8_MYCNV|nr:hypothetical protein [Mycolicibacterium novocastrense]MCV7026918.1 hypothetical protein [Mycolicibacterium novocastrense]GAT08618.1 uncharacterized protein RMCN_1751 [Mycolicibacterium novocastrense]
MRSNPISEVLTALESLYRELAALRLDGLTRTELYALIDQLDKLDHQAAALEQRLFGRLLLDRGATPRDVARRLRISPGEAQRRLGQAAS